MTRLYRKLSFTFCHFIKRWRYPLKCIKTQV